MSNVTQTLTKATPSATFTFVISGRDWWTFARASVPMELRSHGRLAIQQHADPAEPRLIEDSLNWAGHLMVARRAPSCCLPRPGVELPGGAGRPHSLDKVDAFQDGNLHTTLAMPRTGSVMLVRRVVCRKDLCPTATNPAAGLEKSDGNHAPAVAPAFILIAC